MSVRLCVTRVDSAETRRVGDVGSLPHCSPILRLPSTLSWVDCS